MTKKVLFISIAIAVAIIIVAGFTLFTITEFNDSNPRANLNVSVTDDYGQSIKGAKITLTTGQTAKTKATGLAKFNNLRVGEYELKIEKDGYATEMSYAVIDVVANFLGDSHVAISTTARITLSKLGATVTGKAVENINGVKTPVASAEIKLILSNSFVDRLFSATTDSNGVYKFENLPENANYTIEGASVLKNDVIFESSEIYGTTPQLWDSAKLLTTNIEYTPASNQFVVSSDTTIKLNSATSNIIINFSEPVKTELASGISVYTYPSTTNLLVNKTWSTDKKTLTISPVIGTWGEKTTEINVTLTNSTFTSETSGATLGYYSSTYIYAYIENIPVPANVTGLKLTSDSDRHMTEKAGTVLKLEWNAIDDVDYLVYYRDMTSTAYSTLYPTFISNNDGKYIVSVDTGYMSKSQFKDGTSFEVVVYAVKNGVRSLTATKLIINPVS